MRNMVIKETLNHMFTDPHQFNHILNVPLIMLDKLTPSYTLQSTKRLNIGSVGNWGQCY